MKAVVTRIAKINTSAAVYVSAGNYNYVEKHDFSMGDVVFHALGGIIDDENYAAECSRAASEAAKKAHKSAAYKRVEAEILDDFNVVNQFQAVE